MKRETQGVSPLRSYYSYSRLHATDSERHFRFLEDLIFMALKITINRKSQESFIMIISRLSCSRIFATPEKY